MTIWIPCGGGFIAADVIRWREVVWEQAPGGRDRTVNAGDRLVIAEVILDEDGMVELLVLHCTIVSSNPGWVLTPLAKDQTVRRKRRTVERGKPERLRWSDESVRASLARARGI